GGIAVLLTARKLVPDQLFDPEPSGAAWRIGERRNLFVGFGAGLGTCFTYVIIAGLYQYWSGHTPRPGPITALPNNGGLDLLLWLVMLVILAPLIEEALFRGVVFAGFQNSWGRAPAAILTSVVFWVLHLWDMAGFWLAMVGIASMSILTLWLRLRYSAIGPAIAAHVGYNGFIAAVLLLSRLGEGR
ncbi:MAG: CPBP family intramembrane metalloprotease, partial [Bryobacteraceae bacterium]|nr:CPBP family intramembrane metalloprotease [Bryobacteraceae bacterium]